MGKVNHVFSPGFSAIIHRLSLVGIRFKKFIRRTVNPAFSTADVRVVVWASNDVRRGFGLPVKAGNGLAAEFFPGRFPGFLACGNLGLNEIEFSPAVQYAGMGERFVGS